MNHRDEVPQAKSAKGRTPDNARATGISTHDDTLQLERVPPSLATSERVALVRLPLTTPPIRFSPA